MIRSSDIFEAHQRARFMRPDAARWMRPDAARWLSHSTPMSANTAPISRATNAADERMVEAAPVLVWHRRRDGLI
ncbi:hypothetical protein AFEL58S_02447 [Afipia felis]